MNNKQEYYSDFSKYLYNSKTKQYHRLSLFGREKDGMLEIFILKANSNDRFKKLTSKVLYDGYSHYGKNAIPTKFHPIIQNVVIEENNSAKYTFKLFTELFFRKFTTKRPYGIEFEYLADIDDNFIILKNTLKWGNQKLDK